jgi:hypothetical protein
MTTGGQQGTAENEMHNSTTTHYSDVGGTIGGTPSPRHRTVTATGGTPQSPTVDSTHSCECQYHHGSSPTTSATPLESE